MGNLHRVLLAISMRQVRIDDRRVFSVRYPWGVLSDLLRKLARLLPAAIALAGVRQQAYLFVAQEQSVELIPCAL